MRALPLPSPALRCCVVVPARDEEALVGACLEGLARQRAIAPSELEVLLVLDSCRDRTAERAAGVARTRPALALHMLAGDGAGAGAARRRGMDVACERLLALRRPDGLIACTDADSVVDPGWAAAQLRAVGRGARAIGGRIELAPADRERLGAAVIGRRASQARRRHLRLLSEPSPTGSTFEHWQFSGASMAVTAATYREVGGLSPRPLLEDEAFERALVRHGVPIERLLGVRVTTSARLRGRAAAGLAHDLAEALRLEGGLPSRRQG